MIDAKRMIYLFVWVMLIGLVVVHLRTAHVQTVYETTCLLEQEHAIRQDISQQQAVLTQRMQSPGALREQVVALGLDLRPAGRQAQDRDVMLACN